jgi:hypothetical protein
MSDPVSGNLEDDGVDPASAPPEEPGSDLGEDIDGQLQILDPAHGAQPGDDDGEAGEPA